jgi:hypothetical protein
MDFFLAKELLLEEAQKKVCHFSFYLLHCTIECPIVHLSPPPSQGWITRYRKAAGFFSPVLFSCAADTAEAAQAYQGASKAGRCRRQECMSSSTSAIPGLGTGFFGAGYNAGWITSLDLTCKLCNAPANAMATPSSTSSTTPF